MVIQHDSVSVPPPAGESEGRRIQIVGVNHADASLPAQLVDRSVKLQDIGTVKDSIWDVLVECLLELSRITIEDE